MDGRQQMITVTPAAVSKIRKMLDSEGQPALRLGVVGGGCSGLSYKFKYDKTARPSDNVIDVDGVRLLVDPKSMQYLDGMTLDYEETVLEQAFRFRNPNAQKSCGCGKSFVV
ncbi:MAG: iron-sulfur cluster assembly accessory protein [Bryobacterales bacterium]|nr:iron-sulfur cluster assembly accessory protein [Bryobacterales bacterium]